MQYGDCLFVIAPISGDHRCIRGDLVRKAIRCLSLNDIISGERSGRKRRKQTERHHACHHTCRAFQKIRGSHSSTSFFVRTALELLNQSYRESLREMSKEQIDDITIIIYLFRFVNALLYYSAKTAFHFWPYQKTPPMTLQP